MINLGLIEVAHDQNNNLKLSPPSQSILFDNKPVQLVRFQDFKAKKEQKATTTVSKKSLLQQELFEKLRQLRRSLAQQNGLPPYLIFTDASLEAMTKQKPLNDQQFLQIPGVTEKKLRKYGVAFLNEIYEFGKAHPTQFPGITYRITERLYRDGKKIKEIARERELSPNTISSHLAKLYEEGEDIDLSEHISAEEIDLITGYLKVQKRPFVIKEIHQHFKQKFSFDKIKFGVAHFNRESTET